jgi:ABC-type lipoprotein release transport system permease subunit
MRVLALSSAFLQLLLLPGCSRPPPADDGCARAREEAKAAATLRDRVGALESESRRLAAENTRLQESLNRLLTSSALHRSQTSRPAKDAPDIFLGEEMLHMLGVRTGDRVQLVAPSAGEGNPAPRQQEFRVAGSFTTGLGELDAKMALSPLAAAQAFAGMGDEVTAIMVRCRELGDVPRVKAAVEVALGGHPYFARTWDELNRGMFPEGPERASAELRDRIVAANGHLTVLRHTQGFTGYRDAVARIAAVPGVESATPFTLHDVIVSSDTNYTAGYLRGIDRTPVPGQEAKR